MVKHDSTMSSSSEDRARSCEKFLKTKKAMEWFGIMMLWCLACIASAATLLCIATLLHLILEAWNPNSETNRAMRTSEDLKARVEMLEGRLDRMEESR